jgi:hypothetical protein
VFVQAGNVISVNIYRENDKTFDIRGNRISLGFCCFNIALLPAVKYYFVGRNRRREEVWKRSSGEEKVEYVRGTEDEGAKRLDFRFAH